MRIVVEEPIVPVRGSAVPSVLLSELDDDLVDQRLAEARDLHPGPRLDQATVLLPDERLPPSRGRPHADHGARVRRIRRINPPRVTSVFGTESAIVWTLKPLVPFTPAAAGKGIRWRFWNGRRAPRSKIEPRST